MNQYVRENGEGNSVLDYDLLDTAARAGFLSDVCRVAEEIDLVGEDPDLNAAANAAIESLYLDAEIEQETLVWMIDLIRENLAGRATRSDTQSVLETELRWVSGDCKYMAFVSQYQSFLVTKMDEVAGKVRWQYKAFSFGKATPGLNYFWLPDELERICKRHGFEGDAVRSPAWASLRFETSPYPSWVQVLAAIDAAWVATDDD